MSSHDILAIVQQEELCSEMSRIETQTQEQRFSSNALPHMLH